MMAKAWVKTKIRKIGTRADHGFLDAAQVHDDEKSEYRDVKQEFVVEAGGGKKTGKWHPLPTPPKW